MNKKSKPGGLTKVPTGITGFDVLTGGGLPANRASLLLGAPGSGKTVFALHTLVSAAQRGEPGIFVSFNETPQQVVENGAGFGWDLKALEAEKLTFLDARMRPSIVRAGHFDLMGTLAGLRAVATEMGARRVVFDSIDVLLTLLDDRLAEMQEVFRLRDWLLDNGMTGILTASLEPNEPRAAQRHALLQWVADCTVALRLQAGPGVTNRSLRVLKYRGSSHLANEVAFAIGQTGVEVALPREAHAPRSAPSPGRLHPEIEQARKELSARVQELDRFMEMKQAELNFLLEKEATPGEGRARTSRRLGLRSARKPSDKPTPKVG